MKIAAEYNNVRFCYENVCAVNSVTFSIPNNKLTVLVGPNGGGKSTLIKLLIGLIKPDEGAINIHDHLSIGYVEQSFGFDDSFPITVKEVVLTGTMHQKIRPFFKYSKENHHKAQEAIELVNLKGFENRSINQLSGGQLKRVIIARALATDADIIILDEPDSNLDTESLKELYDILNKLKSIKCIILVSHNTDFILDIADEAIYVNKTTQHFDDPKQLKEKLHRGLII